MKRSNWQYQLAAYMASQGISLLGSSVVSLAIIWYITLQTGSGIAVAGVTITTYIPQALVLLPGGVLADRYSPKRIVMLSDTFIALSTLLLAILFANGFNHIGWIFFFNTLRSFGSGLQLPASKSILPQLVPHHQLMRANSIYTGIWTVIQLVSPGLGGLLLAMVDIEFVFLTDVATAVIGVLLLATIPIASRGTDSRTANTRAQLRQGFAYIFSSKPLRYGITIYTIFQFLVVPASQLTPLLASRNIGNDVFVLSVIETAFSVGALLVSLAMAYKTISLPHFQLIGLASIVFGFTMILLLPIKGIVLFALVMLLMGCGSPLYYTPLVTHIQENTEESYMGRTFSYVDLFSSIATPLGMAVFGPLANVNMALPFLLPGGLLILMGLLIRKKTICRSD